MTIVLTLLYTIVLAELLKAEDVKTQVYVIFFGAKFVILNAKQENKKLLKINFAQFD